MPAPLSVLLVPGLNCSARLYAEQIPALWRFGPVTVADHTRDDSMEAIAARILAFAPPRFALAGLSMGGYRLDHAAPGARARDEARAARYLGAPRNAGADGAAQAADRARAVGMLRRGPRAAVSGVRPPQPAERRRAASARARDGGRDGARSFPAPAERDHDARRCAAVVADDPLSHAGAGRRWRRAHATRAVGGTCRGHRRLPARGRSRLRTPLDHGTARGSDARARRMDGGLKDRESRLPPRNAIDFHGIGSRPHRRHAARRGNAHRPRPVPA